jgi:hypothetical protein
VGPNIQRTSTVVCAQLFPPWLSFIGSLDALRRERLGSASSTNVSAALPATATTARDAGPSPAAVAAGIAQAADEASWRRLQAWNEELLSSQPAAQGSGSTLSSVVLGAACLRGGGKPDMQVGGGSLCKVHNITRSCRMACSQHRGWPT